jgi:thaumarchaeosortase
MWSRSTCKSNLVQCIWLKFFNSKILIFSLVGITSQMKFSLVIYRCTWLISTRYDQIIIVILLIWPILLSYVLYPHTFGFSWNEGRGSFLIATILTLIELFGSCPVISCRNKWILITFTILISLYVFSLSFGSSHILSAMGSSAGALVSESWVLMWDYVILAVYFVVTLRITFGNKNGLKIGGAATLFLMGYATILLLDSLFPYDTLGILQYFVPTYLNLTVAFLDSIGHLLNHQPEVITQTFGNTLVLYGPEGPFVMKVYWPSAGVHSIVIFGLVMLAFLLKTATPWKRRLIYLFSGILLTCVVNGMRITLLSLYALNPNLASSSWEQFHSVIGEIIFIPWVLLYLALVICLEKRYHGTSGELRLLDNSCSSKDG